MNDHGRRDVPAGTHWWPLTLLLLAAGISARVLLLEADPYFSAWTGYVIDEGRWVETARNLVLFRTAELHDLSRVHLALSFGFQAATLAAFETFGVHFWTARLFPAVAGVALLVLVAVGLRRWFHPAALAFGVALLAFEHQFLFLSRVAVPEVPALLFAACAFALTVAPGCTPRRALLAGLSAAVAVAMKGTSVFVMPVFGVLMALDPGSNSRPRFLNPAAYTLGFVGPMLVGLVGALALGLLHGGSYFSVPDTLLGFLKPLGFGQIAWRIRYAEFLLPTYVALLCAWLGSFAAFSRPALATSLPHRVLVFATGEKMREAEAAGADYVGGDISRAGEKPGGQHAPRAEGIGLAGHRHEYLLRDVLCQVGIAAHSPQRAIVDQVEVAPHQFAKCRLRSLPRVAGKEDKVVVGSGGTHRVQP